MRDRYWRRLSTKQLEKSPSCVLDERYYHQCTQRRRHSSHMDVKVGNALLCRAARDAFDQESASAVLRLSAGNISRLGMFMESLQQRSPRAPECLLGGATAKPSNLVVDLLRFGSGIRSWVDVMGPRYFEPR